MAFGNARLAGPKSQHFRLPLRPYLLAEACLVPNQPTFSLDLLCSFLDPGHEDCAFSEAWWYIVRRDLNGLTLQNISPQHKWRIRAWKAGL